MKSRSVSMMRIKPRIWEGKVITASWISISNFETESMRMRSWGGQAVVRSSGVNVVLDMSQKNVFGER